MDNHAYRYETESNAGAGTRWAEDSEVRGALTRVDLTEEHIPACGLPLISDGHIAYVDNTDSHSLILGSTGSKKSRLLVMPMMEMIAKAGESVLCTDPKGELYERTSGAFAKAGYRVLVINLREPLRSNGWSPLHMAADLGRRGDMDQAFSVINDLAATLFPLLNRHVDEFWAQTSRAMFAGLAGMIAEKPDAYEHFSLHTIESMVNAMTGERSDMHDLNQLMRAYPEDSLAVNSLETALTGTERTMDNIRVSYRAGVQFLYSRDSLTRMLSTPDVDFSVLGTEKTALYIIMPDEKTTLHPIVAMIIKLCYETLISTAQQCEGLTLPVRVNFLLDEFSNLPPVPDMSSMISAARSRNIRFFLVIQSLHQLQAKYGDDASTIRGNCTNWVFLTSRELALLSEISELCGTRGEQRTPLISTSQLQRLNKQSGEALILCGRLYPYISYLADIDEYPTAKLPPLPLPTLTPPDFTPLNFTRVIWRIRHQYALPDSCVMAEPEEVTFGTWHGRPMRWLRVAELTDVGGELLLAASPVAELPYDEAGSKPAWGQASLSEWLNHKFMDDAFTFRELRRIMELPEKYFPGVLKWPPEQRKFAILSQEELTVLLRHCDLIGGEESMWMRNDLWVPGYLPRLNVATGFDYEEPTKTKIGDSGVGVLSQPINCAHGVRPILMRRMSGVRPTTPACADDGITLPTYEEAFGGKPVRKRASNKSDTDDDFFSFLQEKFRARIDADEDMDDDTGEDEDTGDDDDEDDDETVRIASNAQQVQYIATMLRLGYHTRVALRIAKKMPPDVDEQMLASNAELLLACLGEKALEGLTGEAAVLFITENPARNRERVAVPDMLNFSADDRAKYLEKLPYSTYSPELYDKVQAILSDRLTEAELRTLVTGLHVHGHSMQPECNTLVYLKNLAALPDPTHVLPTLLQNHPDDLFGLDSAPGACLRMLRRHFKEDWLLRLIVSESDIFVNFHPVSSLSAPEGSTPEGIIARLKERFPEAVLTDA